MFISIFWVTSRGGFAWYQMLLLSDFHCAYPKHAFEVLYLFSRYMLLCLHLRAYQVFLSIRSMLLELIHIGNCCEVYKITLLFIMGILVVNNSQQVGLIDWFQLPITKSPYTCITNMGLSQLKYYP